MQTGTLIQITIERIGQQGDGVGKLEGKNVIVPKTAAGDIVSCRIKYIVKDRIHADLIEILQPANSRITPSCKYYDKCGGCGLQHIDSKTYKGYKLDILKNSLQYNNIPFPEINLFSVGQSSRRRAFVRYDNAGKLGFYEHQSHNVVDINKCLILEPALETLLNPLRKLSLSLSTDVEGWMMTSTDNGIDIVLQNEKRPDFKLLEEFAVDHKISRISWNNSKKITPVITNTAPFLIINNREIILPQEYFIQASKAGGNAILNAVIPNVANGAKVLDLFSGLGIYSFALADKAKYINAYEISSVMVKAIEENIARHKLQQRINAHSRDIEKKPLTKEELSKFDTAIINPPRTGALKQAEMLTESNIPKIIMVSCNSQTFARDARILHDKGYRLTSLSAIDQFYYSHHLEQVGIFEIR